MGCRSFPRSLRRSAVSSLGVSVLFAGIAVRPCLAAGHAEPAFDATALAGLEQRAAAAEPRERCYLYSELLHEWTELAGRAMAQGDEPDAVKAIARADADAVHLKAAIANDSKRLRNAELLLEHTARHLSDMVRVASMDQHDSMQAVLKHLNSVHDALLAQIFSH